MALTLRWTPEAEKTFFDIVSYLENSWSEKEVQKFVRKSHEVINNIHRFPKMCSPVGNDGIRKAIISKQNSLFYITDEEQGVIVLLTFWDNRKDPDKLIFNK